MKNLLTAIYSKFSGSTIFSDVGGRVFLDQAPEGTEYPYIVYSIVSDVADWQFVENFEDVVIQFSLFSSSESATEISTMYADLKTLFDDCSLTITDNTLLYFQRDNLATFVEDITTLEANTKVKHWAVDYSIKMQAS